MISLFITNLNIYQMHFSKDKLMFKQLSSKVINAQNTIVLMISDVLCKKGCALMISDAHRLLRIYSWWESFNLATDLFFQFLQRVDEFVWPRETFRAGQSGLLHIGTSTRESVIRVKFKQEFVSCHHHWLWLNLMVIPYIIMLTVAWFYTLLFKAHTCFPLVLMQAGWFLKVVEVG